MVLGLTGGETVLVVMAAVFIVFALAVSMLIPRSRPDFPGDRLGLFIFAVLLLFLGMMTAVVTATGGEERGAEAPRHESTAGRAERRTETGSGETDADRARRPGQRDRPRRPGRAAATRPPARRSSHPPAA